ncbi:hypothetical protein AAGG74_16350 [Bacillus mexicanus]|uniref:hypothetical protein n=1 Tax=Bacillus mexicanus TaxID=2834415 RepID=UPI003D1CEAE7
MENEIDIIKESGFTNVKWYDEDLDYTYYDANLNDAQVEVRVSNEKLEWRYLGYKHLDDIEWYGLRSSAAEKDNDINIKEESCASMDLEDTEVVINEEDYFDNTNEIADEDIKINILVNF